MAKGLRFRVWGLGFGVCGLGQFFPRVGGLRFGDWEIGVTQDDLKFYLVNCIRGHDQLQGIISEQAWFRV